jgi:hypothetical protein
MQQSVEADSAEEPCPSVTLDHLAPAPYLKKVFHLFRLFGFRLPDRGIVGYNFPGTVAAVKIFSRMSEFKNRNA